MIFASSGGAGYGECPGPRPRRAPFLPLSPYGIAKKCGEEYLAGWNRIHGTQHISLRFANVYGPRQDAGLEGGVVAIFLERLARGDETVIFGDGEQRPRLRLRRRHRRRAARRRRAAAAARTTSARATATTVTELHAACAGSPATRRAAPSSRPGSATCGARCSTPADRARARLARRRRALDDGLARTWAWMKEAARA